MEKDQFHLPLTPVGSPPSTVRLTVPPTNPVAPPDDRARQAQELLSLAREDLGAGRYLSCLECCKCLNCCCGDIPEGQEAKQLVAKFELDPARLRQMCQDIAESFAEVHLQLADSLLQQGQPQQATVCCRWWFSGTKPVVRGQSP